MADYPRSLREFQRRFPDDAACGEHLARTRWPGGFACPRCGGWQAWRLPSRTPLTFGCKGCGKETSVTAGTVMHRTHLPLSVWFWAAWLVATQMGIPFTDLFAVVRTSSADDRVIRRRCDSDRLLGEPVEEQAAGL